jgi:hypothetical protein
MAFNNSLVVGTRTYERLTDGEFILSTSTADEPTKFILRSNVRPDSESDYLVKITKAKNSTTAGAKDDVLQAYFVIRYPLKAFTQTEVEAELASLNSFLVTANITKLIRGER